MTAKVMADLERGVLPWLKPWSGGQAGEGVTLLLRHCGAPYQGINILLLWGEAIAKDYRANRWMTYRQACELGAQVRKREHGSLVVYADRITKTEQNDRGEEVEREIRFLMGYTVFNVEQIEGLPEGDYNRPEVGTKKTRADRGGGDVLRSDRRDSPPRRSPGVLLTQLDVIQFPVPEAFRDAESYAATKAHELTHWTAHPSRFNRTLGKRFGDNAYAAEELVAELDAAFFCASLGITPEAHEDHSAYIAHWLRVLKNDRRAIFTAAAHAQRAVDYLHGLALRAA